MSDTPSQKYSTRKISGTTLQHAISKQNNFGQAGAAYLAMSEKDRANLVSNLADDLKQVKSKATQAKMISYFYAANAEYGTRLAQAVGVPMTDVQTLAKR